MTSDEWPSSDDTTPPSTPPPPPAAPPPPPPPPPGGAPSWTPGGGVAAELGVRIGARLIDYLILLAVQLIIITPIVVATVFSGAASGNPFVSASFNGTTFTIGLISAVVNVGYFVWMESNQGATLGKRFLKLKVQAPGGGNLSMEQALRRNIWMAVSILPVLGGLLSLAAVIYIIVTISGSPTNQGWHDQFAGGAQVVQVA